MKNYLYLGIGTMFLATISTLVKLVGNNVHFMTLMFYRVLFAFLFLLIIVPFLDRKAFKLSKKDIKDYFLLGVLWTIGASMFVTANLFAPVQNIVLIHSIYPFFVFLFAFVLLREQITKTKIVTTIIAFIGLAIINPFQSGAYETGNILALFSALVWALVITEMRKEDKSHTIAHIMWFFFFAVLLLLPMPFVFGFGNLAIAWPYVLFLGLVSTGTAYLFYNFGLQKIEAEEASVITTIINPIFAIVFAFLVIAETLEFKTIIGGTILIIAGVYLETHRKKLKSIPKKESFKGK